MIGRRSKDASPLPSSAASRDHSVSVCGRLQCALACTQRVYLEERASPGQGRCETAVSSTNWACERGSHDETLGTALVQADGHGHGLGTLGETSGASCIHHGDNDPVGMKGDLVFNKN